MLMQWFVVSCASLQDGAAIAQLAPLKNEDDSMLQAAKDFTVKSNMVMANTQTIISEMLADTETNTTQSAACPMCRVVKNVATGLCMDHHMGNRNVYWHTCHNNDNQKWYFDGQSRLRSLHDDNLCLDYNYNNGNVYMHNCHGGGNQKWHFNSVGFQTEYDNKCADLRQPHNNMIMANCRAGSNQAYQWWRWFHVTNEAYSGLCMDYHLGNKNVYFHPCHNGNHQQWYFDDHSRLTTRHDNLCLDYNYNDGNVYMHQCHGGSNQKWHFSGGHLKTEYDGKCADVRQGDKNLIMWGRCHGLSHQRFHQDYHN